MNSFLKWLGYIFEEPPLKSLDEWTESKENMAKFIQLISVEDQFRDILEILEHVTIKDIIKELFGIYYQHFEVKT